MTYTPDTCLLRQSHGNPFRYCPACSWMEEPAVAEQPQMFDAPTVERLLAQLIGLCSVTAFWDQMPATYPAGMGTFRDDVANRLLDDALAQLRRLAGETA